MDTRTGGTTTGGTTSLTVVDTMLIDEATRDDARLARLRREAARGGGRRVGAGGLYWGPVDRQARPHGCGLTVWPAGGAYFGQHAHGVRHGEGVDMAASGYLKGTFAAGVPVRGTLTRQHSSGQQKSAWQCSFGVDARGALELHGAGHATHALRDVPFAEVEGVWEHHRLVSGTIATTKLSRQGSFDARYRLVGEGSVTCDRALLRGVFVRDMPWGTVEVRSEHGQMSKTWWIPFSGGLPSSAFVDDRDLSDEARHAECVAFWLIVHLRTTAVTLCQLGANRPAIAFRLPEHGGGGGQYGDSARHLVHLRAIAQRLTQFHQQATQQPGPHGQAYRQAVAALAPLPAWTYRIIGGACTDAVGRLPEAEQARVRAGMRGLARP